MTRPFPLESFGHSLGPFWRPPLAADDCPDLLHKAVACCHCGYLVDAASTTDGEQLAPEDGNIAICFRCAEPSVYVVGPIGVALRLLTRDELAELAADEDAQIVIRRLRARRDRKERAS
jgi:hypothetical protein